MSTGALFARRTWVLRPGDLSVRVPVRSVVVCLALLLGLAVVAVYALVNGEFAVPVSDAVRYLLGADGGLARTVVVEWRLPRVAAAIGFGAALALSGAIFQTITANPLGSPDVIGFNTGAYTGALCVLLVAGAGFALVSVGAFAGGLLTALVVYLLSRRRGVLGLRLILVGIGINAMLTAFNQWLILQADVTTAISAAVWGAGSLNGIRWDQAGPALLALMPLLAAALVLGRRLRMLDLGEDAATAVGLAVHRDRLLLLLVGVSLTAVATAVAGPIAFVALAAPQLAARLARSPGIALLPAACLGALLLTVSDVVAGHAFAPIQVPVGVVTVCVGGAYLVWLLIKEARR